MASTTFIDKITTIPTAWLNDTNTLIYTVFSAAASVVEALAALGKVTKYKTADESVASSTTLQDDDHLAGWALEADTIYSITGLLLYIADNSTPQIKFGMDVDQTPQFGEFGATDDHTAYTIDTTPEEYPEGAGTTLKKAAIVGLIHTHATLTTTLNFQFAQNVSDAGNSTLKKGSYIVVEKLVQ